MQVAYYALHYGREYLAHSVQSVQDAVDEIHVFYVDRPSYGFSQGAPCPDSREELEAQARKLCTKPLIWHDCPHFNGEGAHRAHAIKTLKDRGAHQIMIVDADEVWLPGEAQRTLNMVTLANRAGRWTMPFIHFIRSTSHAVTDHFRPVRLIDLRHSVHKEEHAEGFGPVLHFGYAQREAILRYKWTCHGHQAELRPGWMDRFMAWTPESRDLHPVVIDLWEQAQKVDDDLQPKLAKALEGHPYLELDLIP